MRKTQLQNKHKKPCSSTWDPATKHFPPKKTLFERKPKLETDILYDTTFWEECNFAQKTQQRLHSPTIPPGFVDSHGLAQVESF